MNNSEIDKKIKELELKRDNIITVIKKDITEMLENSPINRIESENAKFCSKLLYDFVKKRLGYFQNDTQEELLNSITALKGFFEILDLYENEQIEKFKYLMTRCKYER